MSSVQDYEKCPQCGGVYVVEFNCRTYEEYKFCHRCGKTEEYSIIRNDDGEPVLDEKGAPEYITKDNMGYGCIFLSGKKGVSTSYSFNEPYDLEEMKESYLKSLENPDIDAETSYFVYWDTDKKEIVVLFGYDPGTYRDFEKSIDENEAPF